MMLGPRTQSSPISPSGTGWPFSPINLSSTPGSGRPTETSVLGHSTLVCAIVGEHSVIPNPLCSTRPNSFSVADLIAGSSGAPDEEMMRRAGNLNDSSFLIFAYSINWPNIAGTPSTTVKRSFSIEERPATGSKRGGRYRVARHGKADGVGHGQNSIQAIIGSERADFRGHRRDEQDVLVRQHDALGDTGGARGGDEGGATTGRVGVDSLGSRR